jgi:pyrroline-5-carboxylate reductase
MNMTTIGFIGGGRVARILLTGWARTVALPGKVLVSDPDETVVASLRSHFSATELIASVPSEAAACRIVFLAVHPPVMGETLTGIAGNLRDESVVISLAPKFTIAKISELLHGHSRVARSIPNAPSLVGAGYNPLCFGPGVTDAERMEVRGLFELLGACPEVDEFKLEAYAILTAMGPTYFWPQFLELHRLSREFGLTDSESMEGLQAMVSGSLRTIAEAGLDADELLDLIPVKPMGEKVEGLLAAYGQNLSQVYQKIRP